ncbi:MAG: hypothetical protein CL470_07030 [Acidimicrobiaceae bacterium]|nr:hypothetical protein [Acidimicrobiaceae bacterium]
MPDQLEIVIVPIDDHPTAQVLAIGALLALEWAAPYADITIGSDGLSVCEPSPQVAGGLLRLSSDRKERLGIAARSATHSGETKIHLVENDDGDWNLSTKLDPWTATGLFFAASTFTPATTAGAALQRILDVPKREDPRTIELLELSQDWALQQIDHMIQDVASRSPRRIANTLQSATAELEALTHTHELLRSRYQADIEIMNPDPDSDPNP